MRTFVVAKVIVVNDKGELLVLRRSQTDDRRPGQWDFPGGWVEADEDTIAAVKREAAEEAGLVLKDPSLVFAFTEMTTHHGSGTWLLFIEHVTGKPKVTLSYEHDESTWKKPQELLKEITYDRQRKMLAYVLENHVIEKN
jgi:8-oxo-dGTP pyrophosphatase MutT (NUDIX family)